MSAELVLDARNATGESPVWRASEQALYWADIPRGVLHRWLAGQLQHTQWQLPQMLACMAAWNGDGQRWVAGLEDGIYEVAAKEGVETALAATVNDRFELKNEASDLMYHLLVLLQDQDLDLSKVIGRLRERHQK